MGCLWEHWGYVWGKKEGTFRWMWWSRDSHGWRIKVTPQLGTTKESPLPGLSKSCFDMADYKPVQDLPDEAVELLDEGSHSPNTMIEQPKVEIQEQDQDTTRQRLTASPSSSVINLANTVLGSGMLAMVSQILYERVGLDYRACYFLKFWSLSFA
jgi:hypothetical protein